MDGGDSIQGHISKFDTHVLSEGTARIYPIPGNGKYVFEYVDGIALLKNIEKIARVSHRSEEDVQENSTERFIRSVVLNHGDWSVVEHANVTVEFYVDRGVTHEIVRHRIAEYTQESTRFVNYTKKMNPVFICPKEIKERIDSFDIWLYCVQVCEESYRKLIALGHKPEIARSVFPTCLASKLVVTFNLRQWRHFFLMRTSKNCHPQMLEVTVPLLQKFQELIPILYEDIVPLQAQKDNLRLPR